MATHNDPPDPLDRLLDRWGDSAPPPADRLESDVWRRIASAETAANRRPSWLEGIESMFSRWSFTGAFVAASVLLGLFLAEHRVSRMHAESSSQFVQNYLRRIDPLVDRVEAKRQP